MNNNTICLSTKVYVLLCILNPLLSVYISPLPGVDLGTFAVLLCFVFLFLNNKNTFKMSMSLAVLICYTIFCTILGLSGNLYSSEFSIIMRLLRFVIMMVLVLGVGFWTYFDEKYYIKCLSIVSLIVAGYAILQYLTYNLVGIELMNVFGPVKQASELDLSDIGYRPPSFFLEPSSATYFMTPFLCYSLFRNNKYTRTDYIHIMIVSLGIVVTTSGQGLFVLITCWGIWFLRQILNLKFTRCLLFAGIFFLVYYGFDFQYTIERIFTTDELNAVEARSGGYEILQSISIDKLILGHGFGNYDENIYYSSFAEIIFCTGIIGAILVFIMYVRFFVKGVFFQRMLVLSSFILMAGGGIYSATFLCLYLPLLFADFSNRKLAK